MSDRTGMPLEARNGDRSVEVNADKLIDEVFEEIDLMARGNTAMPDAPQEIPERVHLQSVPPIVISDARAPASDVPIKSAEEIRAARKRRSVDRWFLLGSFACLLVTLFIILWRQGHLQKALSLLVGRETNTEEAIVPAEDTPEKSQAEFAIYMQRSLERIRSDASEPPKKPPVASSSAPTPTAATPPKIPKSISPLGSDRQPDDLAVALNRLATVLETSSAAGAPPSNAAAAPKPPKSPKIPNLAKKAESNSTTAKKPETAEKTANKEEKENKEEKDSTVEPGGVAEVAVKPETSSEPEYTESEYSEDEYAEPEYTESEYSEDEYAEPEYAESEYSEDEVAYEDTEVEVAETTAGAAETADEAEETVTSSIFGSNTSGSDTSGSESEETTPAPSGSHTLVGIMELGERSAALLEIEGTPSRVQVGEDVGASGWILIDVRDQQAILRRDDEERSVYIGESF